jgi:hypothetical protein
VISALRLPRPVPGRITELDALGLAIFAAMGLLAITLPSLHGWVPLLLAGVALIARDLYTGQPTGAIWLACAMPTFSALAGLGFGIVNIFTPVTFDAQLARLDLGIAPWVRGLAMRTSTLPMLTAVYMALPEALLLALVLIRTSDRGRFLKAAALGLALCPLWYLLWPAVGPIHAGDRNAPRNCMPSMHLTWALLIWSNSRGLTRLLAGVFAALTALATLATGEHYFPDLLAAGPWTWTLNQLAGGKK